LFVFFCVGFELCVCVCVCVWSCRRGGHEQQKGEEQYKDWLEKVSLLKPSPQW
jgi:hypothetical protein